ncbi:MAG: hypothetical protein WCW61_04145 [Patescibacteria group bacterium]|jgi:hypothetical protein
MKNISFISFSPFTSDPELTAQLVDCYREVFADNPWNEWLKCSVCQKYWGLKDRGFLASIKFCHCGQPLVDFWPRTEVISDLYHEIVPESSCWLALDDKKVVGFCWGYPILAGVLEDKLGIVFCDSLNIPRDGLIAYQDEIGVLMPYRNQHNAKAMFLNRQEDFLEQRLRFFIVRTRRYPESSATFLWYTQKLGYKILAAYPEEDGRVILGMDVFTVPLGNASSS